MVEDGRSPLRRTSRGWLHGGALLLAPLAVVVAVLCCSDEPPPEGRFPTPPQAASPEAAAAQEPELWRGVPLPPWAQRSIHEEFLADRERHFAAADGGGSARLLEGSDVAAGQPGRWVFEYTAGPLGIAVGGALYFQVSPFWGWSDPQADFPEYDGYTTLETSSKDTRLDVAAGQSLLILRIEGAPLAAGETLRIAYGDGDAGARADRFAEARECFYFWVDGDGDGTRKLIDQDVTVAVRPRPASDFLVTAPSTAWPGEPFEVCVAFLDPVADAAPDFTGEVSWRAPEGLTMEATTGITAEDRGSRRVAAVAAEPGVYVVEAEVKGATRRSNPVVVSPDVAPVYWADLHGHSALSDGTGTPEDYYLYARDFAALDVAVLTDHDHYGLRKVDEQPEVWEHIKEVTRSFHEPGKFVTLIGYEWTNWLFGHRHVLYFQDDGSVLSCLDPGTDMPPGLWKALEGKSALTVAHHPGGGPVAVDWSFAPPPEIEPVVEIVSVHGSSEAAGTENSIYNPTPGGFVRDALARGYRLGFVGSGDSHNGHPGLVHFGSPSGGVAAIRARELTRQGIYAALRARASYATSGERIYLEFHLGATPMGSVHTLAAEGPAPSYTVRVVGTAPIDYVELVRNGKPLIRFQGGEGESIEARVEFTDPGLARGDYTYARVLQKNRGLAWSSPIWVE